MLCISSNEHYLAAGIDCYNKAVNKLVASHKQDLALKLCVEVSSSQGILGYRRVCKSSITLCVQ